VAASVVDLPRAEIAHIALVFGRAFHDNPMTRFCVPDENARPGKLSWFFEVALRCGVEYGTVHTTSIGEGAALWLPPGGWELRLGQLLRRGFLPAPFRLGLGPLRRLFGCLNHLDGIHRRLMSDPHWFLFLMGVDPPRQGQGVGGRIIAPALQRADEDGLPCYLETDKRRNLDFYGKHGFDVVYEGDIPRGGPHFWAMRRDPR
jgi:GNAT superfamily N-acetyltransferase